MFWGGRMTRVMSSREHLEPLEIKVFLCLLPKSAHEFEDILLHLLCIASYFCFSTWDIVIFLSFHKVF